MYKFIASVVLALLLGQSLHAQSVLSLSELTKGATTDSQFMLEGIDRPGLGSDALLLQPMQVYTPDAKLVIVDPDGSERPLPRPATRFYIGELIGEPGSRVFLSITEKGEIFGLVNGMAGIHTLLPRHDDAGRLKGLELSKVDRSRLPGNAEDFRCEQDRLPMPPPDTRTARSAGAEVIQPQGTLFRARVAVDTDFEFFQQFASATEATDYVANLIGFASTIYVAQLDTEMQVSYLRLWNTAADPWVQTSSACALFEFGKHWNDNMAGESRTIAHLLSGKNTGGGVAWVGVLCNGGFDYNASGDGCPGLGGTSNYGGGYGFTGEMSGAFDAGSPTAVWDIVASAHEIGHNFNSPHTHCYANLGGNASPVDQCYGIEPGCYAGAASLPGAQGTGSGTIMSYCHLRPGGMSNISLTLGQGHGFGVAPERVPQRMRDHVVARTAAFPQCLATGVLPVPAAPATLAGTSIGDNGFTASWTRPSGSTGFFLDLSTQANFSSFVPGFQDLAVGAVQSHAITGLSSGTTYHYRVRAANGGGTSANSNVTPVTTTGGGGGNETLNVSRSGAGTGSVSSVPAGIDCGATCSADYASGTVVNLSAVPTIGSVFAGWSGDCSGSGACSVSMTQTRNVTASFEVIDGTLEEGFETVSGGCVDGWVCVNNSATIGTTGWFQGSSGTFPAQAGAPTAYIAANFENTTGSNTISNWLISPQVIFESGSELRFWTRTVNSPTFADRIEVRLSSAGASTNVGGTAGSVGDFGTLLTTVNPSLLAGAGVCPPGTGSYPNTWCEFVLENVDGIPTSGIGRIALRYFVTSGGPSGANSDYIGIDTVSFAGAVVNTPPSIAYDPNAGTTISYDNAGTAAPISATPSGGSGSDTDATTTVGACSITGGGAAFPTTSIDQISFVGATTTAQNLVLPDCVTLKQPTTATLSCTEARAGSAPVDRQWTLVCSGGPMVFADGFESVVPTYVGGIISSNTSWTVANSPYEITSTVQIDVGVTLTIDPGVEVQGGAIQVWGTLNAIGTAENPVLLASIDLVPGTNASDTRFSVNVSHAIISGQSSIFYPTGNGYYGSLSLTDSTISSNLDYVYLWYPTADALVARNVFQGYAEFQVGHGDADPGGVAVRAVFRNNRFMGGGAIINWAAYGEPTLVELNLFEDASFRVGLREGHADAALDATSNYWGTTNVATIEAMILDRNDSLGYATIVPFEPYLTADHADTP